MENRERRRDEELIRAWLRASRESQGLPAAIEDVVIVARVEKRFSTAITRRAKSR